MTRFLKQEIPRSSALSRAVLSFVPRLTPSFHIEGLITIIFHPNSVQMFPLDILVGARELEGELQPFFRTSERKAGPSRLHLGGQTDPALGIA